MNTTNIDQDNTTQQSKLQPPAVTLALNGRHLIEASAGTGKTWTLTGVVLRLIVEGGYPCEKIIATTFTRSASADMRQRINERLQSFYQLLLFILNPPNDDKNNDEKKEFLFKNSLSNFNANGLNDEEKNQRFKDFFTELDSEILKHSKALHEQYEDKVNYALLEHIVKQMFQIEQKDPKLDFLLAKRRTQTALNQLDKLFVSTLDSLCQKWLLEFSSETGYSSDVQISNDVSHVVGAMVHDQLRGFMAFIYNRHADDTALYQFISAKLKLADDFEKAVERALNFYTAHIDIVPLMDFDLKKLPTLAQRIAEFYDDEFEVWFDESYRLNAQMNKSLVLHKTFNLIKNIRQDFSQTHFPNWFFEKNSKENKLLTEIAEFFSKGKGFKKDSEVYQQSLSNFAIMQDLYQVYQLQQQMLVYIDNLSQHFTQFIANYVRENLPKVLDAQGLTTFSLQLAKLNQALQGSQGDALAKYIRHEYPIALIDESQDVNTEQALLIERLYLNNDKNNDKQLDKQSQKGFLLLVGDPKQAIYGFRGGDVKNYTILKKKFGKNTYYLTDNFRSSQSLISNLNTWYGVGENAVMASDTPTNTAMPNQLGENIEYQKINANRADSYLIDPTQDDKTLPTVYHLRADYKQAFINMEQDDDSDNNDSVVSESDMVVAQIALWFDKNDDNHQSLVFRKEIETDEQNAKPIYEDKPLQLSDICILATKNKYLNIIEKQLNNHGIATLRGGSQSVFSDSMSRDMFALMNCLLNPYHQSKLRTLLLSNFFQMRLEHINQLFAENAHDNDNPQLLDSIQQAIIDAGEMWQKDNLLVAVQSLFNKKFDINGQNLTIWQRLAQHEAGERWLVDMRHLFDIIHDFLSENQNGAGEYQLFDWFAEQLQTEPTDEQYLQHRLTSENGVKLMTIHQSKGLEFEVVFVVGLTDNLMTLKEPYLYLYSQNNEHLKNRHLTALASDGQFDFKQMETDNNYEERLRLLYVALTRAKEQVYIVTVGQKEFRNKTSPLKPFVRMVKKDKQFVQDIKDFVLDERLVNAVKLIDTSEQNSLSKKMAELQQNPKYQVNFEQTTENNDDLKNKQKFINDYNQRIAKINQLSYQGWASTSFTNLLKLAQNQQTHNQDDTIEIKDVDNVEENIIPPVANIVNPSDLPMRFRFEKGTSAGTFLHGVLEDLVNANFNEKRGFDEHLSFDDPDNFVAKRWATIIDKALRKTQLPKSYYSTQSASEFQGEKNTKKDEPFQTDYLHLANWLKDIMLTPLQAPRQHDGTPYDKPLRLIDIEQKQAEMGFNLKFSKKISITELNNLFDKYGITLNLQSTHQEQLWEYLKGEIDLVYQHDNRFYIVDYKSNFLGNDFDDYQHDNLHKAMQHHHYFLQACIYQVALHRFLKLRLVDYDMDTHLVAVEYAFLRGMSPEIDRVGVGSYVFDINNALVTELDELFGNTFNQAHNKDK